MKISNEILATYTITLVIDHKELDELTTALDAQETEDITAEGRRLLADLYNGLMEAFGSR